MLAGLALAATFAMNAKAQETDALTGKMEIEFNPRVANNQNDKGIPSKASIRSSK